ncbi:hypothetical protein JOD57_001559 [Geodermatophilus bullaregiensis]|uniref:DUF2510 domain-containing protein n=1 Tax=Geodermatophilus bullaregiensis TaxID=1564160 RepID=UPI00195AEB06|nr:DUF2510 domain-containing protein [Geodermatophilus bullaregiensis]MBM7805722.1 hypothetical protein [Geodermatophilus bullaregiensis]
MTGSGQPSAPAGWYPDPDGAAGMVRWWDGGGWSDVTTPAGPGVAVRAAPVTAPPRPPLAPSDGSPWQAAPPRPAARARTARLVAGGVLAVVVVVVVALVVGLSGGSDTTVADPPLDDPPAGPTFPPGTVRIVDEEAGISYPFLGNGWYEYDLRPMAETRTTAGQYFTTQEQTPAGVFIAQCTSGPVSPGYGWTGPGSEQATVTALADRVRVAYYPYPNEREVLRDEALTVDGANAHLIEFQLTWDVEGYDSTGERAALLVIDVGRPDPALLYVSVPDTHAELYGVIDRVVAGVDVL